MTKTISKMDNQDTNTSEMYCSFCGDSQHKVNKLIVGPGATICDECVSLCVEVLEDVFTTESSPETSPKHQQIMTDLNKIRRLDTQAYKDACSYIKGVHDGLKWSKNNPQQPGKETSKQ